jgi:hypothetical protein
MIALRLRHLSDSTLPAVKATGGTIVCMAMCACMENLTSRDTF